MLLFSAGGAQERERPSPSTAGAARHPHVHAMSLRHSGKEILALQDWSGPNETCWLQESRVSQSCMSDTVQPCLLQLRSEVKKSSIALTPGSYEPESIYLFILTNSGLNSGILVVFLVFSALWNTPDIFLLLIFQLCCFQFCLHAFSWSISCLFSASFNLKSSRRKLFLFVFFWKVVTGWMKPWRNVISGSSEI